MSNATGVVCDAELSYPFGASEVYHGLGVVRVVQL